MYELVFTNTITGRESTYEHDALLGAVEQLRSDVLGGLATGWDNIEIRPKPYNQYRIERTTTTTQVVKARSEEEALCKHAPEDGHTTTRTEVHLIDSGQHPL